MNKCLLLVFLFASPALCVASSQAARAGDPCPSTNSSRIWSASCFAKSASGIKAKKQHLKKIRFDRQGYAALIVEKPLQFIVINRLGQVVNLKEDHLADFNFEAGEGEVSRFGYAQGKRTSTTPFKCGYYFTGTKKVMVPPLYDNCGQFYKGSALVCMGCTSHCESGDCHEDNFAGGEGIVINSRNEVLKRYALPALPLCEGHAPAGAAAQESEKKKCRPREPNPFDKLM